MEDNDRLMLLQKGMDATSNESWQGQKGQLWVTGGEFCGGNGREDIRGR